MAAVGTFGKSRGASRTSARSGASGRTLRSNDAIDPKPIFKVLGPDPLRYVESGYFMRAGGQCSHANFKHKATTDARSVKSFGQAQ